MDEGGGRELSEGQRSAKRVSGAVICLNPG